jgi:nitric oxide reductase NorE protein
MGVGTLFLAAKFHEYAGKFAHGIGIETSPFWTLYFLSTGFHALHVVLGIVILGLVSHYASRQNVETGTAFWHMVDVIWIMLYPIVYLVRI